MKQVVPIGLLGVRDIEVDKIARSMRGNARSDPLHQIPMRINEGTSMPPLYVLSDEGFEQGRLAGSSFPDDVHMSKPVGFLDAEGSKGMTGVGEGEV